MRVMPNFQDSTYGFHHTVDSALQTLADLQVAPHRVTVKMAGLGAPDRWVIRQQPAAGAEIDGGVQVALWVSGLGYFEHLPVGMWHRGDEAAPGVNDIVKVFDDPLQKAIHWVRQGSRLFNIRRDNPSACSRWIRLFGLRPEDWPEEHWYHLALLAPRLQAAAGSREGIRLTLLLLLGLPLAGIRSRPAFRPIPPALRSSLGAKASRLGIDWTAGDRIEDLAELRIRVGPTSLETYYEYHQEGRERLRQAVRLATPCYQSWAIDWLVTDPNRAPSLGIAESNSKLGVNMHLGEPAAAAT